MLVAFVVVVVWEQLNQAERGHRGRGVGDLRSAARFDGLAGRDRAGIQQSLIDYTKDVVDDEFPRMRRGETIEQQSEHLTAVWNSFLHIEPTKQSEIAFYQQSITRLDELGSARKNTNLRQPVGDSRRVVGVAVGGAAW